MYSLGRMPYWLLPSLLGQRHHLPDICTIEAEVGPWQIRKQRPLGDRGQMPLASPVTVALPLPGAQTCEPTEGHFLFKPDQVLSVTR